MGCEAVSDRLGGGLAAAPGVEREEAEVRLLECGATGKSSPPAPEGVVFDLLPALLRVRVRALHSAATDKPEEAAPEDPVLGVRPHEDLARRFMRALLPPEAGHLARVRLSADYPREQARQDLPADRYPIHEWAQPLPAVSHGVPARPERVQLPKS